MGQILSMKEAAAYLGVSVRTVYRLIAQGHLKAYRLTGRKRSFGALITELVKFVERAT
jgi:excisionase family DNA binding protein